MRLALAIDGGLKDAESGLTIAVSAEAARILNEFATGELLVWPLDLRTGEVGTIRLVGIAVDEAGHHTAHFAAHRRLGSAALAARLHGLPSFQFISDGDYAAILATADLETFVQPEPAPGGEIDEYAVAFNHGAETFATTAHAVLDTLRRQTGNLCALTSKALAPDAPPTAIRTEGPDRLHLNNLLLLSPAAEEAFRQGHFTIRDDFSIIVDFQRIDPELLEMINPNGRLLFPSNLLLRPAPENLAWHRHHVFRLD